MMLFHSQMKIKLKQVHAAKDIDTYIEKPGVVIDLYYYIGNEQP